MLTSDQRQRLRVPIERYPLVLYAESRVIADSPYAAMYNTERRKIIGTVKSEKVAPSHLESVDLLEEILREREEEAAVSQLQLLNEGILMYAHYQLTSYQIDAAVDGDDPFFLTPEVIVRNGYNGKTFYGIEFGFAAEDKSVTFRLLTDPSYTDPFTDKTALSHMLSSFTSAGLDALTERIHAMQATPARALTTYRRLAEHVQRCFSNRMVEEYHRGAHELGHREGFTLWEMFLLLQKISGQRISYLNRRASDLVFAEELGMIWRRRALGNGAHTGEA